MIQEHSKLEQILTDLEKTSRNFYSTCSENYGLVACSNPSQNSSRIVVSDLEELSTVMNHVVPIRAIFLSFKGSHGLFIANSNSIGFLDFRAPSCPIFSLPDIEFEIEPARVNILGIKYHKEKLLGLVQTKRTREPDKLELCVFTGSNLTGACELKLKMELLPAFVLFIPSGDTIYLQNESSISPNLLFGNSSALRNEVGHELSFETGIKRVTLIDSKESEPKTDTFLIETVDQLRVVSFHLKENKWEELFSSTESWGQFFIMKASSKWVLANVDSYSKNLNLKIGENLVKMVLALTPEEIKTKSTRLSLKKGVANAGLLVSNIKVNFAGNFVLEEETNVRVISLKDSFEDIARGKVGNAKFEEYLLSNQQASFISVTLTPNSHFLIGELMHQVVIFKRSPENKKNFVLVAKANWSDQEGVKKIVPMVSSKDSEVLEFVYVVTESKILVFKVPLEKNNLIGLGVVAPLKSPGSPMRRSSFSQSGAVFQEQFRNHGRALTSEEESKDESKEGREKIIEEDENNSVDIERQERNDEKDLIQMEMKFELSVPAKIVEACFNQALLAIVSSDGSVRVLDLNGQSKDLKIAKEKQGSLDNHSGINETNHLLGSPNNDGPLKGLDVDKLPYLLAYQDNTIAIVAEDSVACYPEHPKLSDRLEQLRVFLFEPHPHQREPSPRNSLFLAKSKSSSESQKPLKQTSFRARAMMSASVLQNEENGIDQRRNVESIASRYVLNWSSNFSWVAAWDHQPFGVIAIFKKMVLKKGNPTLIHALQVDLNDFRPQLGWGLEEFDSYGEINKKFLVVKTKANVLVIDPETKNAKNLTTKQNDEICGFAIGFNQSRTTHNRQNHKKGEYLEGGTPGRELNQCDEGKYYKDANEIIITNPRNRLTMFSLLQNRSMCLQHEYLSPLFAAGMENNMIYVIYDRTSIICIDYTKALQRKETPYHIYFDISPSPITMLILKSHSHENNANSHRKTGEQPETCPTVSGSNTETWFYVTTFDWEVLSLSLSSEPGAKMTARKLRVLPNVPKLLQFMKFEGQECIVVGCATSELILFSNRLDSVIMSIHLGIVFTMSDRLYVSHKPDAPGEIKLYRKQGRFKPIMVIRARVKREEEHLRVDVTQEEYENENILDKYDLDGIKTGLFETFICSHLLDRSLEIPRKLKDPDAPEIHCMTFNQGEGVVNSNHFGYYRYHYPDDCLYFYEFFHVLQTLEDGTSVEAMSVHLNPRKTCESPKLSVFSSHGFFAQFYGRFTRLVQYRKGPRVKTKGTELEIGLFNSKNAVKMAEEFEKERNDKSRSFLESRNKGDLEALEKKQIPEETVQKITGFQNKDQVSGSDFHFTKMIDFFYEKPIEARELKIIQTPQNQFFALLTEKEKEKDLNKVIFQCISGQNEGIFGLIVSQEGEEIVGMASESLSILVVDASEQKLHIKLLKEMTGFPLVESLVVAGEREKIDMESLKRARLVQNDEKIEWTSKGKVTRVKNPLMSSGHLVKEKNLEQIQRKLESAMNIEKEKPDFEENLEIPNERSNQNTPRGRISIGFYDQAFIENKRSFPEDKKEEKTDESDQVASLLKNSSSFKRLHRLSQDQIVFDCIITAERPPVSYIVIPKDKYSSITIYDQISKFRIHLIEKLNLLPSVQFGLKEVKASGLTFAIYDEITEKLVLMNFEPAIQTQRRFYSASSYSGSSSFYGSSQVSGVDITHLLSPKDFRVYEISTGKLNLAMGNLLMASVGLLPKSHGPFVILAFQNEKEGSKAETMKILKSKSPESGETSIQLEETQIKEAQAIHHLYNELLVVNSGKRTLVYDGLNDEVVLNFQLEVQCLAKGNRLIVSMDQKAQVYSLGRASDDSKEHLGRHSLTQKPESVKRTQNSDKPAFKIQKLFEFPLSSFKLISFSEDGSHMLFQDENQGTEIYYKDNQNKFHLLTNFEESTSNKTYQTNCGSIVLTTNDLVMHIVFSYDVTSLHFQVGKGTLSTQNEFLYGVNPNSIDVFNSRIISFEESFVVKYSSPANKLNSQSSQFDAIRTNAVAKKESIVAMGKVGRIVSTSLQHENLNESQILLEFPMDRGSIAKIAVSQSRVYIKIGSPVGELFYFNSAHKHNGELAAHAWIPLEKEINEPLQVQKYFVFSMASDRDVLVDVGIDPRANKVDVSCFSFTFTSIEGAHDPLKAIGEELGAHERISSVEKSKSFFGESFQFLKEEDIKGSLACLKFSEEDKIQSWESFVCLNLERKEILEGDNTTIPEPDSVETPLEPRLRKNGSVILCSFIEKNSSDVCSYQLLLSHSITAMAGTESAKDDQEFPACFGDLTGHILLYTRESISRETFSDQIEKEKAPFVEIKVSLVLQASEKQIVALSKHESYIVSMDNDGVIRLTHTGYRVSFKIKQHFVGIVTQMKFLNGQNLVFCTEYGETFKLDWKMKSIETIGENIEKEYFCFAGENKTKVRMKIWTNEQEMDTQVIFSEYKWIFRVPIIQEQVTEDQNDSNGSDLRHSSMMEKSRLSISGVRESSGSFKRRNSVAPKTTKKNSFAKKLTKRFLRKQSNQNRMISGRISRQVGKADVIHHENTELRTKQIDDFEPMSSEYSLVLFNKEPCFYIYIIPLDDPSSTNPEVKCKKIEESSVPSGHIVSFKANKSFSRGSTSSSMKNKAMDKINSSGEKSNKKLKEKGDYTLSYIVYLDSSMKFYVAQIQYFSWTNHCSFSILNKISFRRALNYLVWEDVSNYLFKSDQVHFISHSHNAVASGDSENKVDFLNLSFLGKGNQITSSLYVSESNNVFMGMESGSIFVMDFFTKENLFECTEAKSASPVTHLLLYPGSTNVVVVDSGFNCLQFDANHIDVEILRFQLKRTEDDNITALVASSSGMLYAYTKKKRVMRFQPGFKEEIVNLLISSQNTGMMFKQKELRRLLGSYHHYANLHCLSMVLSEFCQKAFNSGKSRIYKNIKEKTLGEVLQDEDLIGLIAKNIQAADLVSLFKSVPRSMHHILRGFILKLFEKSHILPPSTCDIFGVFAECFETRKIVEEFGEDFWVSFFKNSFIEEERFVHQRFIRKKIIFMPEMYSDYESFKIQSQKAMKWNENVIIRWLKSTVTWCQRGKKSNSRRSKAKEESARSYDGLVKGKLSYSKFSIDWKNGFSQQVLLIFLIFSQFQTAEGNKILTDPNWTKLISYFFYKLRFRIGYFYLAINIVFLFCFFLLGFVLSHDLPPDTRTEYTFLVLVLLVNVLLLIWELLQLLNYIRVSNFLYYFKSLTSWMDLSKLAITSAYVIQRLLQTESGSLSQLYRLGFFISVVRCTSFLKIFEPMRDLVTRIINITYEVRTFFYILLISLFGFCHVYYVVADNDGSNTYYNTLLNTFFIFFGNIESGNENDVFSYFIFFVIAVFLPILLMNLLVFLHSGIAGILSLFVYCVDAEFGVFLKWLGKIGGVVD